jgi:hypothetical protein
MNKNLLHASDNTEVANQQKENIMHNDDDRGGSSPDRDPNDDRSDVMNPNNDAYDADQANRASQDDD